jgi:hypothetical protein
MTVIQKSYIIYSFHPKYRLLKLFILSFLGLFVSLVIISGLQVNVSASGDNYYVSPSGSNSSGDGSEGNPWLSPTFSASQVLPGDTVCLRPGNYLEEFKLPEGVNGQELVSLTTEVSVEGSNVYFDNQDLSSVEVGDYVYIYRSWKGNNGSYKIISVDYNQNSVVVDSSDLLSESGNVTGNSEEDLQFLSASIGRPIIFQNCPQAGDSGKPKVQLLAIGINYLPRDNNGNLLPTSEDWANDYIIIDGLETSPTISGSSVGGFHINGSHNVIKNSISRDHDWVGFTIRSRVLSSYNQLISNEVVLNQETSEGVYIGSGGVHTSIYGDSVQNGNSKFNHILNNKFYTLSDNLPVENAIDIKEANPVSNSRNEGNLVAGNEIRELDGVNSNALVQVGPGASKTLIYGNKFANQEVISGNRMGNIGVMLNDKDNSLPTEDIYVFNNLIYTLPSYDNLDVFGITVYTDQNYSSKVGEGSNINILNNTIYGLDTAFRTSGTTDNSTGNIQFKNNLLHSNVDDVNNYFGFPGFVDLSNNLFSNQSPLFTSPSLEWESGH